MHNIPKWYFDSMPRAGEKFVTNPKLKSKVDAEGGLKLFCGETTVFLLPEDVRKTFGEIQSRLYSEAGEMLCRQRLAAENFHMTLHSLWDMDEDIKFRDAPYESADVCRTLDGIRRDCPGEIMMRAVCPLNMVNTSVVMGLAAATEGDGRRLGEIYSRMSRLYPRYYGLTPHVTLAYYLPGEYGCEVWQRLKDAIQAAEFVFPIKTENLVFQRFFDMDRYETVY